MKKTLTTALLTAAGILSLGFVAPSKWIPWEGHPPARTLFSKSNKNLPDWNNPNYANWKIFETVPSGKKLVITNVVFGGGNGIDIALSSELNFPGNYFSFYRDYPLNLGIHGIVFDSNETILCSEVNSTWTFTGYYTDAY